jgi:type II secretory pathway pseudopilin PulG
MSKRRNKVIECLVVLAIVVLVVALLFPPAISETEPRHHSACRQQLHRLGLALRAYCDAYGSFPPAYVADADGYPMHSWRVLILPFLEQQEIYDQYRFDEPWNGPHNAELQERTKPALHGLFTCPNENWSQRPRTVSYLAVVGSDAAWPGPRGRTQAELSGKRADTAQIVEVHDSGIQPFEPRDLNFDSMCFGINDPSHCGIRAPHYHRTYWTKSIASRFAQALFADGTVREITEVTPARLVRAMLTIEHDGDVRRD